MTLKEAIVIKNDFVVMRKDARSRNATPGNYIMDYTARLDAVEPVLPAKQLRLDNYITRYTARSSAVEKLRLPEREMYQIVKEVDGQAGIGFGTRGVSMSGFELKEVSKNFQDAYREGKTVLKIVLSFDNDYLREMGLVPDDFEPKLPGDYRGVLDQLKLREAVMHGVKRLGHRFDDLLYVSTIQYDTMHIHVHMEMVDLGEGRLKLFGRYKGEQVGMLSDKEMNKIRRGIDTYLDATKSLHHLHANVTNERSHARDVIRKELYGQLADDARLQLIAASLPKNRLLWAAGSKDKSMRQANRLCMTYVKDVMRENPEDFKGAEVAVETYADYRVEREGLKPDQKQQLIDKGREAVVKGCMNTVYDMFRDMGKNVDLIKTPTITASALELETLAAKSRGDDFTEACIRFKGYSTRLKEHKERHKAMRKAKEAFVKKAIADNKRDTGSATLPAEAKYMTQYYNSEIDYEFKCLIKYQHLLGEFARDREKEEYWRRVIAELNERLHNLGKPGEYSTNEYKYSLMDDIQKSTIEAATDGWLVMRDKNDIILKEEFYQPFEKVKAIDLHDLSLDFKDNIKVSSKNIKAYREMVEKRNNRAIEAKNYLEMTGQEAFVDMLPLDELKAMRETLYTVEKTDQIASKRQEAEDRSPLKLSAFKAGDAKLDGLDKRMFKAADEVVAHISDVIESVEVEDSGEIRALML